MDTTILIHHSEEIHNCLLLTKGRNLNLLVLFFVSPPPTQLLERARLLALYLCLRLCMRQGESEERLVYLQTVCQPSHEPFL